MQKGSSCRRIRDEGSHQALAGTEARAKTGASEEGLTALAWAVREGHPEIAEALLQAGGIGSGIQATAQYNYHLDNVPEMNRATWLSWNLLLGDTALLLGSIAGPYLAGWTGTPLALILFGIMRLVTGVL